MKETTGCGEPPRSCQVLIAMTAPNVSTSSNRIEHAQSRKCERKHRESRVIHTQASLCGRCTLAAALSTMIKLRCRRTFVFKKKKNVHWSSLSKEAVAFDPGSQEHELNTGLFLTSCRSIATLVEYEKKAESRYEGTPNTLSSLWIVLAKGKQGPWLQRLEGSTI